MSLEVTHRFAIPLRDGFDYIVEPRNWPEYWPGLVRAQPGSRWRAPGDRAYDAANGRNLEGRLQRVRSGGAAPSTA